LAAAAAAGVLNSVLFGIAPRDPLTFTGVPIGLGVVAAAAILVPAWRATRIDPVSALRNE
jgi:ABC-type lipoprotein release transport system permease subunit